MHVAAADDGNCCCSMIVIDCNYLAKVLLLSNFAFHLFSHLSTCNLSTCKPGNLVTCQPGTCKHVTPVNLCFTLAKVSRSSTNDLLQSKIGKSYKDALDLMDAKRDQDILRGLLTNLTSIRFASRLEECKSRGLQTCIHEIGGRSKCQERFNKPSASKVRL